MSWLIRHFNLTREITKSWTELQHTEASMQIFTRSIGCKHLRCDTYLSPALPVRMALVGGEGGSWTQGVGVGEANRLGEGRVETFSI